MERPQSKNKGLSLRGSPSDSGGGGGSEWDKVKKGLWWLGTAICYWSVEYFCVGLLPIWTHLVMHLVVPDMYVKPNPVLLQAAQPLTPQAQAVINDLVQHAADASFQAELCVLAIVFAGAAWLCAAGMTWHTRGTRRRSSSYALGVASALLCCVASVTLPLLVEGRAPESKFPVILVTFALVLSFFATVAARRLHGAHTPQPSPASQPLK